MEATTVPTSVRASPRVEKALETLNWYHSALGLTWEDVAEAVGISSRTIHRWRELETSPSGDSLKSIERLDEVRFWIETVFERPEYGIDEAREWFHTRVRELRGKTPREALLAGKAEQIIEILATAHAGAFV